MTKTFIVAFDGSDQANKALDVAGRSSLMKWPILGCPM